MMNTELEVLGDAIHAATARELAGSAAGTWRSLRPLAVLALVAALALPAAGYAAGVWQPGHATPKQEQRSLPRGEALFAGTHPQCEATGADSYQCLLATAPTAEYAASWLGAKEASVDARGRINGGCVGKNSAGTEWDCYLGQAAVDHGVIDAGVLGSQRDNPAHG
jgi:hypothetical protein